MEAFADFFRDLYDTTGLNFVIFYEEYESERFIAGIWTSLKLIVICLILSLIVGIVGAWAQGAKSRILRLVMAGYIQFFRNTPPFVQILFFYFVVGTTLERAGLMPLVDAGGWTEPLIGNFGWAVVSLSFFAGAFNVEIFRSGIEAVPTSTRDAR